MTEEPIVIDSGDRVPVEWGAPREARRKNPVTIREPVGIEVFDKPWGQLVATPGVDWVVVDETGEAYPIKKTIFEQTYRTIGPGHYRKVAHSRLVQVPEGWVAVLTTLEGEIEVRHPDYLVIGADNEVYANSCAWVEANLEFVE